MKKLIVCGMLAALLVSPDFTYAKEDKQTDTPSISAASIKKMFTKTEFVQTELIIKISKKLTSAEKVAFIKQYKVSDMQSIGHNFYNLSFPKGADVAEKAKTLSQDNKIEIVEPNYKIKKEYIPKDPLYKNQWHHTKINSPKAWDLTKGSSSVIVAVVDDGVQTNHPDLTGKIYKPYDVLDNNTTYYAGEHATHVAGIIAASMNKVGGSGMAPNVKIMPINVFYGDSTTSEDVASAIVYAADNGADVINLSLGGYNYSYLTEYAVNYAISKGAILVAAAGNDNTYRTTYPAGYAGVIGISATDRSDYATDFSNYGSYVDFAAPGEDIYSTVLNSKYNYMSGTSMAAPVVSGTVALMLSKNPILTNADVNNILRKSTKDLYSKGWDYYSGYGRIDASKAVASTPAPLSKITLSASHFKMTGINSVSSTFYAHTNSLVTVFVKDSKGKTIRTLTKNYRSTGKQIKVFWNGKTDSGLFVGSGNYQIVVQAANGINRIGKETAVTVTNNVPPSISLDKTTVYFSSKVSKSTALKFTTNKSMKVTAKVYDKKGTVIQTLLTNKSYGAGTYSMAWNGKNSKGKLMADGDYKIRYDIVDSSKRKGSSKTVTVKVDTKAPIVKSYAISPAVLKAGKESGINGKLSTGETAIFNIHIVNEKNQKVRNVALNKSYKNGTYTLIWDGKSDQKAVVPEGKYKFVFEGKDTAGNKATTNSGWFNVQDWTAPVVNIPASVNFYNKDQQLKVNYSTSKSGKISIEVKKGNVTVKKLLNNVSVNPGNNSFTWDGKDIEGNLVTDGDYQYSISFIDKYNQTKSVSGTIKVVFTTVEISSPLSVRYYPYSDDSVGEVYYNLSNQAYVTVEILDNNNNKVRTIESNSQKAKGINHFAWDGLDDDGYTAYYYYTEPFKYSITASGSNGIKIAASGIFDEEADPSWLKSKSYRFISGSNPYHYDKFELKLNTSEKAKLYLDVYDYYYDDTPLHTNSYDLKIGDNTITYTKSPEMIDEYLYYVIYLEDSLGNYYAYAIDEYDYETSLFVKSMESSLVPANANKKLN